MTTLAQLRFEPRQVAKTPPCAAECAAGGDPRGWIAVIAQRGKLRMTDAEAYARAWSMIAAANPFPATLGRICPSRCESRCTRKNLDGAVAINALERFLGDWALRQRLGLPILESRRQPESLGVIGAGPAGLSFAYQTARRGYRVTVYEKQRTPGGMLKHAVPSFRLPADVLDAEIRRLLDVGVELMTQTEVGRDVSVAELRNCHRALFVGIGAPRGMRLDTPGEQGSGVWVGVEYLSAIKRAESVALGSRVVVIGGGNTAVDAARVARRRGAHVTILYRRSRLEMPANAREIDAALSEGVAVECLSSPLRIERDHGSVTGVIAQRVRLAEADASGRRRCVPVAQTEFTLAADAVIVAVSQMTDWSEIEELRLPDRAATYDGGDRGDEPRGVAVLAGGDVLQPGIAATAIAQGRRAAEMLHAKLRGLSELRDGEECVAGPSPLVKTDCYEKKSPVRIRSRPVKERLAHADAEVEDSLSEHAFLGEIARCFSCGLCFGCEQCFMFCSAGAFARLGTPQPGAYFGFAADRCEGCGKCVELCPCGFLSFASWSVSKGTVVGYS